MATRRNTRYPEILTRPWVLPSMTRPLRSAIVEAMSSDVRSVGTAKTKEERDIAMTADLIEALRLRPSPQDLTTCSVCLRVLNGSHWMRQKR